MVYTYVYRHIHTYNEILFILKKGENSAISNNVDKPREYYTNTSYISLLLYKLDREGQFMVPFIKEIQND